MTATRPTATRPTATRDTAANRAGSRTPTDRLLTGALVVGPLLYLVADSLYAARGWDDATAAVFHVLGAIGYGLVVLCVASWSPRSSRLAAVLVLCGLVGMAGDVGYGFDAIHASLGDVPLVDRSGAATLIKPLGLFVPLSFVLIALALRNLGRRGPAALVLVAAVAWPVAHIANVAPLAVAVNLGLVVAFGSLAWSGRPAGDAAA